MYYFSRTILDPDVAGQTTVRHHRDPTNRNPWQDFYSDNEAPGAGEMDAQEASEEDSLEDSEEEECQAGGEFPSDEEEWLSADGGEGEESEDDDFFDLEDA